MRSPAAPCPLCRCPPPAHDFGCWALLEPVPVTEFATTARVVAFGDVVFAHLKEAGELRRLARTCPDPHTKRALLERARGHERTSRREPDR